MAKMRPLTVINSNIDFQSILERWQEQEWMVSDIERYLAVKHVLFRKYKFNIYVLQKYALLIQHWWVSKRARHQKEE